LKLPYTGVIKIVHVFYYGFEEAKVIKLTNYLTVKIPRKNLFDSTTPKSGSFSCITTQLKE
jgi:hypothetical protein